MITLNKVSVGLLCGTLLLVGGLAGCERKVIETTKTVDGPNGSSVEKKTTIQHDDGTITQQKETTTVQH